MSDLENIGKSFMYYFKRLLDFAAITWTTLVVAVALFFYFIEDSADLYMMSMSLPAVIYLAIRRKSRQELAAKKKQLREQTNERLAKQEIAKEMKASETETFEKESNYTNPKSKKINKPGFIALGALIIIVVILGINTTVKQKEIQKANEDTYKNIKIENKIENMEIKKEKLGPEGIVFTAKLKDGYVTSNTGVDAKDEKNVHLRATLKYPNKDEVNTSWENVVLNSDTDNLTLTLSDFSGAKSIVFTGYDLTIVAKEQAEIDKKLEEQAKQEELAKQQEQDQLLAEVNEQTRFTKTSDVRGTQVWSIYVEAGRSLRVYGNAGNNLSISIRDESGNLKNTDLVIGDFDQVYNLSSQYNGHYTVEIRYNPLNQNKWDFQVL